MSDFRPPDGSDPWPERDLESPEGDDREPGQPEAPDSQERDPWSTEVPEPWDAEERDPWGAPEPPGEPRPPEPEPRQRFPWGGRQSDASGGEPEAREWESDSWGGSESPPEEPQPPEPEESRPPEPEPEEPPPEPEADEPHPPESEPRQRFSWRGRQSEASGGEPEAREWGSDSWGRSELPPEPEPEEPRPPEREPEPEEPRPPEPEQDAPWPAEREPEPEEPRPPEPEPDAPWPAEPAEGPSEPEDLAEEEAGPTTESAPATTTLGGGDGWDPKVSGERRRPTTAEQAVPWLIGIILALAGMVVVLLALILSGPDSLLGSLASASPTPAPSLAATPEPSPSVQPEPTETPTPLPTPIVTPSPIPTYGPLEMVYLGRQTATAPIYLLRHDFSTNLAKNPPAVMAQSSSGIHSYAWSPDGTRGVAIASGTAVALIPGQKTRDLGSNISAVTFGLDSETVFAVRIVASGTSDRAEILAIDFASGGARQLTAITYPHPVVAQESALKEAQFLDDGGLTRIYATNDGNLALWVLGAPATYRIDSADGSVLNAAGPPELWSPDGLFQIGVTESSGKTTLTKLDRAGATKATVTVTGVVSHLRWAPSRNEIVFTLGQSTSGGGVRQDLYVWDLVDGKAPSALTSNGASFGATWLGVPQSWQQK